MPPDAQHVLNHFARLARRLQSLRQDDVVERIIRVIGEVSVGIALDNREAFGDRRVHALARELDAAPINTAQLEQTQKLAITAADVEHA